MTAGRLIGMITLQVILILVNAFFAATEIAVLQLSSAKVKKKMQEGDKSAPRILKLIENPSDFLSSIQVGITFAGFLGSAFAADNFAAPLATWVYEGLGFQKLSYGVLNTIAIILITLILSYFTLVFGELVPKRLALHKPYAIAKATTGIVAGIAFFVKPLIILLTASTSAVLKLFGINDQSRNEFVTEEEIRIMVDAGTESGTIDNEEKEMIENVFRLDKTPARDLMTKRVDVVAIEADSTTEEIIEIIQESGLSRIPVYDDSFDDFMGILSTRAYLLNLRTENPKPLRDILMKAWYVPETVPADVLLRDMKNRKEHMSIVMDEYGGFAGIVTMEDIIEKIFGDIYDEFDLYEDPDIYKIEDNLWRIAGDATIETIEKELGLRLPEDRDYETLGGLVFSTLSSIPNDGCEITVDVYGIHIHTEPVEDHRVEWAKVSIIESSDEEDSASADSSRDEDS